MDPATITALGTGLATVITAAIKEGKTRGEAELEAARAVERGDVVSDELFDRLTAYVKDTKDFEEKG